MVSTRTSNKLKKVSGAQQKGEFVNLDDSDNESIDWERLVEEDSDRSKGKAPAAFKREKVRKNGNPLSVKRKRVSKRLGKGEQSGTQSPIAPEQPLMEHGEVVITPERMRAFEGRECIGERHVDLVTLRGHCPRFGRLIDEYGLAPICSFPEKTGFCLDLVKSFYMNSSNLQDTEGGVFEFRTVVREICLTITPQLIGEVLGMRVELEGTDFMKATSPLTSLWKEFVDRLCIPGTISTGFSVPSRQLKQEYRLLNLIICFNILPNLQSKVIRWDRMFFLYLYDDPEAQEDVNFNIPCVIWQRMARFVGSTLSNERLPFPMIIMRILRKFGINTASTSSVFSSGTINASTIAKSRSSAHDRTSEPSRTTRPTVAGSSAQAFTLDGDISLTSIHNEQQRLSRRQDQICQKLEAITRKINSMHKLVKRLSEKNGCALSSESESD